MAGFCLHDGLFHRLSIIFVRRRSRPGCSSSVLSELWSAAMGSLQYFGFEPLLKGYYYTPYIPISTLGHRNQAAQYLILLIPLSGVFFVLSRSRARRLIFGFSTLLMIYHLFLTKSRGAFVGFILSFLFVVVIMIYKWLERYPFFYRKKRVVLILLIFFPFLLIFIFFIFPTTRTLRVKHVNPAGYYIHSIDGSKIPANQPIRIEFDFRILKGSPEKPGYVNLHGERTNSSPIYLEPRQRGMESPQTRGYLFLHRLHMMRTLN